MNLTTFLRIKRAFKEDKYNYGSNKWRDAALKKLDASQRYDIPIKTLATIGGTLPGIVSKPLLKLPTPAAAILAAGGGLGTYALTDYALDNAHKLNRGKVLEINRQYNKKHRIKSLFNN